MCFFVRNIAAVKLTTGHRWPNVFTGGPGSLRVGRWIEKCSASVAPGLKQLIILLGLEDGDRCKDRTVQGVLSIFYLCIYLFYAVCHTVLMIFTPMNLFKPLQLFEADILFVVVKFILLW